MILVFGDDSADKKRERVSAVAVVLGTEEQWQDLEQKWVARIETIPFHARDCESDQGDYRIFCHQQNKELYKDLATMMVLSGLGGFGVAVDLVAQRQVFPESLDLAYYKSFIEILESVKNLVVNLHDIAKFTFDISIENHYNAGLLYDQFRKNDSVMGEYFWHEISFAPAKEHPRLQVADLMAYESMKALDHSVGPVKRTRKSWDALRATQRFDAHGYSHDWFNDLKRNYAELERKVGFHKQDYLDWLKQKGRQHSISNIFHFMSWVGKNHPSSGENNG
jgi:hypothetical protein